MRVQCVASTPDGHQIQVLGSAFRGGATKYPVHEGLEYIALGVGVWSQVAWVEVAMETETVVSVPLFLFKITDPSPSSLWRVRLHPDGALTLWPPEFYEEFFHDRLSEGKKEEVQALRRIQKWMQGEMKDPST